MKAYKQGISKTEFVNEMKAHEVADRFLRGRYWKDGKGCAVGCGIKSIATLKKLPITDFSQHYLMEKHLGIPEWLVRLADAVFEGMSLKKSKVWPVKFASAINPGADLESVKVKFGCIVLEHALLSIDKCVYDEKAWPQVKDSVAQFKASMKAMIKAQKSGNIVAINTASKPVRAAHSAVWAAWFSTAITLTIEADKVAAAVRTVRTAALGTSSVVRPTAVSMVDATAWAAEAAWLAEGAAQAVAYDYYANELLKLLKACKGKKS